MTKVSIIIPLYNAESTVRDCLSSVMAQTLDGIEVILVDDHSQDGCLAAAQQLLMSGDLAWESLSLPANAGPGVARNAGMERASGKYIAFVDADDRLDPRYCERLWQTAEEAGADMVWCQAEIPAAGGDETGRNKDEQTGGGSAAGKGSVPDKAEGRVLRNEYVPDRGRLLRRMVTYLWTCMFRREFVRAQGLQFPATRCAEDSCFVLEAVMAAGVIATVDESLYEYRPAESSLSRRRNRRRAHDRLLSMRELRRWAHERGFARLYRWSLRLVTFKKGWLLAAKDLITG